MTLPFLFIKPAIRGQLLYHIFIDKYKLYTILLYCIKIEENIMNNNYIENPQVVADKYGQDYAQRCHKIHKKEYGQYLTPIKVAAFMGSLISKNEKNEITILDPGIGTAILTCAVCENALLKIRGLKTINIIGYEIDPEIVPYTRKSLNYLSKWLKSRGVETSIEIIEDDFILHNSDILDYTEKLFSDKSIQNKIDIIISNPPYFKINKNDPRSKVVHGQPNIYSLFMTVSAFMLKNDGEMIFITPRSYTSGFYFKSFRELFFSEITPEQFHLFASRNEAFERDDVLQEHLIIHGKRKTGIIKVDKKIIISHSHNSSDLDSIIKRNALLKDVIDFDSKNKFLFLPLSDNEENTIAFVNSWTGNLHKYNMEISTGKVVPFRTSELIFKETNDLGDYAPLIWMNHIKNEKIEWPIENWRKEQFLIINDNSMPLLIPNGNYVLMRRFSPKEEKNRINTAPLYQNNFKVAYIGLENHVNYIHRPNGELSIEEITGLSAILNSQYLDIYFRTLNGNTEVSATEIRNIPLPDYDFIINVGKIIIEEGIQSINLEKLFLSKKSGAA